MPPLQTLSPEQLVKPRQFELRISLIFLTIFVSLGIHLPYFPLWLEAKGFAAEEIAIILSAPMFLRVVTTPFITAMADRAKDRSNILVLMIATALLLSLGYFLQPTYTVVLGVSLVLAVFWTPQTPLTDSLALSGVRRFGSVYARMRIWGSISFLVANFIGGAIIAAYGATTVPTMISVGLAVALVLSFFAPRLGQPRKASPLSATDIQEAAPKLLNAYFLFFVIGAGIIIASHGFLYGFVSIYWKSIELSETLVGLLWAWAVVAEVGMFMIFTRVFSHIRTSTLLVMAGVAAMARWLLYPLIWPAGLGVIGFFAVQTLHAFSTGLILIGLQKMIGETVVEERMGAAQGIAYFANGFAMAAVTLFSGALYDRLGVDGFFVMAGVAAIGLGFILLAARSAPKRRLGR
ncbi:PPP family 3-phenylpropionic acid transporter [Pseudaminobacter salicylatoxidans]|uniref:PPP family 3-phenylpropionic acid transporter n=1 Tax=Pseudaminobacter salicylatoxidans TaxID=93369 RepID=A0A316CV51_PSESE|nr:MFS transporter [Pseudaminobacter salicylatoxidans]PWJ85964.1 PPP family 3-phenylpropionic acid transporter [Pseudaminobacter salicylatoxidans]